ncbi:hypothetical protein HL666_11440 [Bradyrhizobium sp. 83002]|uniref:hypothetical protein n=1 Tax=Bradyrhizobium aeschynomenes TaxID=2734909 RepID=UPI0015563881|nr:hypothetical protein [Bradyrhizobium aeschynomenes]NPU11377.1 hypothetical protein [Bradyrhizobium aeschynomenes]
MTPDFSLSPAAYALEAQDIAAQILSARVEALFEKQWGPKWPQLILDKMKQADNEKRKTNPESRGRILFKVVNGKAEWDFLQMLHALSDNAHAISSLSKQNGPIRGLCFRLIQGRNQLAHKKAGFDRNDVGFAKAHIESLISLARFLVGEQDMEPVKRLLNHLIEKSRPSPGSEHRESAQSVTDAQAAKQDELAEIRAMLQDVAKVLDERLIAQSPPAAKLTPPPTPLAGSPAAQAGRTRRRTPIPAPRHGLVAFPIVAEGADADQYGELGYLSCSRYEPESRQDFLSRVIGFEGHGRSDAYYRIIMDAREEETNHAKANLYTHSRIDPGGFGGDSFGLAAALADRSARYGWADQVQQRRIVATGVITRSRAGEIGPVDSFLEKLKLLERTQSEDAIFVCPAANLRTASDAEKALLEHLQNAKRIRIRAGDRISDLEDLFCQPETAKPSSADERSAVASNPEPPPTPSATTDVKKTRMPAAALAMVAAFGAIAVLSTVYLAATFVNRDRLPAELAQKIADLVQAQAGRQASAMSAQDCSDLTRAARGVAGIEPRRLDASANAALAEASACARRAADSDTRLSNVADAARQLVSAGLGPSTCTSLAVAVDHLEAFDQDRLGAIHKQALSNASACRPLLADSEKRLADFDRRASAIIPASGDLSACDTLVAAGRQLSDPDIARLQAKSGGAYDKLTTCATRVQSSDSRIRTFVNAADAFVPSNVGSVEALVAARSSLQPEDVGRLDLSRKDKLLRDAAQASELLGSSDARIGAFVASYREWQRSSTQSNALAFDRAGRLSDFDRPRLTSSEARDAQAALSTVRKELGARADRWSLVERLTAAATRQSPADYWKSLNDAVGRLNQKDQEGATSEQMVTLEKAHELLAAGARRTIPSEEFATMPAPRARSNGLDGYQRPPPIPDDFATVPSNSSTYNSRR